MPRGRRGSALGGQLSKMISKLREQRSKHADALQKIDDMFASLGITTHLAGDKTPRRGRPGRKPGKPAASAKQVHRSGRKFKTTGNEAILAFVKKAGAKGVMGETIAEHWKSEGRGAGVYVNIGKLVKAKKLKREDIKGERGSRYTAV